MRTPCRTRLASALAATLAVAGLAAMIALAGGAHAQAATTDEPSPAVRAEMPTASTADTSGAATSTPSGTAAAKSTPSSTGWWHELTPEELKLPIFNRLNLDLERGAALLSDVKDNNFGYDESAFYYLVQLALKNPEALQPVAEDPVDFDTLLAMPSSYRGKVVTINGMYMSCMPFAPPPIAVRKDIQKVYRVDLRAVPDDGTEKPYATVIVLEDPMTYLHTQDIVHVRGYFYKVLQYKYASGKGTGAAPLLVARRLEPMDGARSANPAAEQTTDRWTLLIAIGVLVLLAGGFFTARQLTRSKHNAGPKRQVFQFNLQREHRKRFAGGAGPGGKDSGPKS